MDLLWRGIEEAKARNAFRQALHRLRAAVGDEVLPQDRERLRLVPGDSLDVDLDRFEAAVAAHRFADALGIGSGDFLQDASLAEPPFDMWVEQERTRFRARIAQLLADATAEASAAGRSAEAVAHSSRLMQVAPLEASSAHLAATTLIAAGRRQEARELLKQFAATLDAELGLQLPAELQSMLARIERQVTPAEGPTRARPLTRDAIPFAGRERELSQLVTLCRTTSEEAGGFALVKAEAGMGKSRLLAELVSHLRSLGRITVLQGREHVAGVQLPYAVFAEALRPLVRAPGIAGASRHLLAEAARLLPELRDGMELPVVSDVEDEAGRLRFFEGIAALVDAAAFERPIVLVVDDVHLAGPSTLELLSYLCARLSRSAVTFVYALQPSAAPASLLGRLESLARPDSQTHAGRSLLLELAPLNRDAAYSVVSAATAQLGIDDTTLSHVVARAEGVPASLVELVRRVARGETIATTPVSLREVLVDRIARLSSIQRRLLFVVALIGRPVPRALAGRAAHLPDGAVGDALAALERENLVEVGPDAVIDMDDATRRIASDIAGSSTRAFLSGWIADELSAHSAPAAESARFFAAAGQPRPAFEQSRLAAFAALRVGALPEATHHLHVARNFAPSPDELGGIESLLSAIGSGNPRIAATAAPPKEASAAEAQHRGSAAAMQLETLFPNWRVLLGAAVATLAVSALVLADRPEQPIATTASKADTLILDEAGMRRSATGSLADGFIVGPRRAPQARNPAWVDSLARPWTNPMPAPRGQYVAVERVGPAGTSLFVISADRRDTVPLHVNGADARAFGWSPDGRLLLAGVARDTEDFATQLVAFSGFGGDVERRIIDATAGRSVIEAAWSPEGTRIAWVSRVGDRRQSEVFVSNADGSGIRNVSRHPAEDHHIAWSPNGALLAFSSARDDNAELYAWSFLEDRLWRLTNDPAQDDLARFSNDSRLVAFESTRGGSASVYVMPALGGEMQRVDAGTQVSIVEWSGDAMRYIDRVVIEQPGRIRQGDSTTIRVVGLDQFDEPLSVAAVEWRAPDSTLLRALDVGDAALRVTAVGAGVGRVVASVGGWRFDTAFVALGSGPVTLLRNEGNQGPFWRALGSPRPAISGTSVLLLSDREWDSGILSRSSVPLLPGLVLQATLALPIGAARDPAAHVSVAYVAPEDTTTIDPDAPQFLRLASLSWDAESGRLIYAVGREFFSESMAELGMTDSRLPFQLRVEHDSTLSFRVAGQIRWRSSLRAISARQSARGQVWISSRATGSSAALTGTAIRMEPVNNP